MFVGDYNQWAPPPPEEPAPRRLTPRGERVLARLVMFNVVLLLAAPIGGATLIQAVLAWWRNP